MGVDGDFREACVGQDLPHSIAIGDGGTTAGGSDGGVAAGTASPHTKPGPVGSKTHKGVPDDDSGGGGIKL